MNLYAESQVGSVNAAARSGADGDTGAARGRPAERRGRYGCPPGGGPGPVAGTASVRSGALRPRREGDCHGPGTGTARGRPGDRRDLGAGRACQPGTGTGAGGGGGTAAGRLMDSSVSGRARRARDPRGRPTVRYVYHCADCAFTGPERPTGVAAGADRGRHRETAHLDDVPDDRIAVRPGPADRVAAAARLLLVGGMVGFLRGLVAVDRLARRVGRSTRRAGRAAAGTRRRRVRRGRRG